MNHATMNREVLAGTPAPALQRTEYALFPAEMVLTPVSRNPIRLEQATVAAVIDRPVPTCFVRHDPFAPLISIVVVTFNSLVFTRMCLESLLTNTDYANYEVLVGDNNSTDGTRDYLRQLSSTHSHLRVLLNDSNLGFAAANNRTLQDARGEILVLLSNDTIVPHGWLTSLVGHLRDAEIGLVGATTNRIGNEAEIETTYRTYGEFEQFAAQYTRMHNGEAFDIPTPCMFCLAMRRDAFQRIGPLDERFDVGMFEDDDCAARAREQGYRLVCAEDVFIHHFGQGSFGDLVPTGDHGRLFANNKRKFQAKWGRPWQPHDRRRNPAYEDLQERIHSAVRNVTPLGATVLVVSKGDEDLLNLLRADGRTAWHFPQLSDGSYPGCYPADSQTAIALLEKLRANGAAFMLFPHTALWWLEHYRQFAEHLERRYPQVIQYRDTCLIYVLCEEGLSDA